MAAPGRRKARRQNGHLRKRQRGNGGSAVARPEADRRLRALAANDILSLFGLKLESWAGRYALRSRTGKMAVVDNLGSLWAEAERLAGQACDPLDPMVLAKLEARSR
jgi:hypothetical protein